MPGRRGAGARGVGGRPARASEGGRRDSPGQIRSDRRSSKGRRARSRPNSTPCRRLLGGAPKFPPAMRLEFLVRWFQRKSSPRPAPWSRRLSRRWRPADVLPRWRGSSSLFRGRSLARPSLRKDALRQRDARPRSICWPSAPSGHPDDARIARETLDYLLAEMTPDQGGFFAAQGRRLRRPGGCLLRLGPAHAHGGPWARRPRRSSPRVSASLPAGISRTGRRSCPVFASLPDLAKTIRTLGRRHRGDPGRPRRRMYEARAPARLAGPGREAPDGLDGASRFRRRAGRAPALQSRGTKWAARAAADRIPPRVQEGRRALPTARRTERPGFRASPPTMPFSSRRSSTSTRPPSTSKPQGYFRAALDLQKELDERFFDPAPRLLPWRQGAHDGPDPVSARNLRRGDPSSNFRRGDEPSAPLLVHGRAK